MPAHSSLKVSNSHNTLKSSIVPGGFLTLGLKLDTIRHTLLITTLNIHTLGPQLQHSSTARQSVPESDTLRFLGLMPAIQQYKINHQRDIIHEVTGLNGMGCWRFQNPMADSSTTAALILNVIAGDCWARCQLRRGIKDFSLSSKLRKSLTHVRAVFIDILAIPELNGKSLYNHCSDPESDCRRL